MHILSFVYVHVIIQWNYTMNSFIYRFLIIINIINFRLVILETSTLYIMEI